MRHTSDVRPERPSGRDERTDDEQRRAGDGEEVGVVVNESMQSVSERHDGEHHRGVSVVAARAPNRTTGGDRGADDDDREQSEPDEPEVGEQLERHASAAR